MNRRNKSKPPRLDMIWSEKQGMWLDLDTRTSEQTEQDRRIARAVEADQKRLESALRAADRAQDDTRAAIDGAAQTLAMSVLKALIQAREERALSQAEVARRMGVPQPAVVRLEAGTHSPTLTTVSRYAAAIGVALQVRHQPRPKLARPRLRRRVRVKRLRARAR